MNRTLFSKNFIFLLIGQMLSMFGNKIIRFAISLYILDVTQSAAIYGTVISIYYLPGIFLSPLGGILADRGDKKQLMVVLDAGYCAITCMMGMIFKRHGSFLLVAGLLIILSMLSAFEGPVSSTCIPLIQRNENLTRANAISNQITSLSGLLTPFLSGLLYGFAGAGRLHLLMFFCAVFFLLAAGIELLLKIPRPEADAHGTIAKTVKNDMHGILRLVFREKRPIGETMLLNGVLTFLVMPYLSIGMTYLISVPLHLPAVWNGSAQVIAGIATLLGGTAATLISAKFQTRNLYQFLMMMGASLLFLIPALHKDIPAKAAFVLVCATTASILLTANAAGVFIISGMQKACPKNMLGRLMALFNVCNNLTLPIGIWLHGILYEKYSDKLGIVFGAIALFTMIAAARGKKIYAQLQDCA